MSNALTLSKDQAKTVLSAINRDYARENSRRQMFERKVKEARPGSRSAEMSAYNAFDSAKRMTQLEEAHKIISEFVK